MAKTLEWCDVGFGSGDGYGFVDKIHQETDQRKIEVSLACLPFA